MATGRPDLPDSVFEDALTKLSLLFNSSVAHSMAESQSETCGNELSLILYSPIEGGEDVIDTAVQLIAERINASVKIIDIVQLVNEQPRSFWTDLPKYGDDQESESNSGEENNQAAGYFNMQEPINHAKLFELVDSASLRSDGASEVARQPESNRHIVYIRDFGFLATFAPTCYSKIMDTVLQRRSESEAGGDSQATNVHTAVILGASPLLIKGGLFQKEESKKRSRRDSSPDSAFLSFLRSLQSAGQSSSESNKSLDDWSEGKNAEKLRDQRLRQQHEMWNNGSLTDHIHEHLDRTSVLTESVDGRPLHSKRLPTCVV
ncbi:hypothetical protein FRC11_008060, partial [Ceratobasidium sp. 423]